MRAATRGALSARCLDEGKEGIEGAAQLERARRLAAGALARQHLADVAVAEGEVALPSAAARSGQSAAPEAPPQRDSRYVSTKSAAANRIAFTKAMKATVR